MSDVSALVTLAAVLIVKNEADNIQPCLASLQDVVDSVFVYDTGSTDNTVALAEAAGAVVSSGPWTDDFAAARNAATAQTAVEWVLSIDADERVSAEPSLLRAALLTTSADALRVDIHVEHDEGPYDFPAVRLFRPLVAHWSGRVHEQIVAKVATLDVESLPPEILRLVHNGYQTPEQRAHRARRNADIAQRGITESGTSPNDRVAVARSYLDLGRSYLSMGEPQNAADAFEEVRSRFPGTPEFVEATDFFVRLLLAEQMHNEVLAVTQQLSEAGASVEYCDWIAAQALVQLGRYAEADELLANVHQVVDTSGRVHSAAALAELKSLVAQLKNLHS